MQNTPKPSAGVFPTAEGLGIFVGVAAWDLLTEGQLEFIKALAIAAPCTLIWYGMRCWRKPRPPEQH